MLRCSWISKTSAAQRKGRAGRVRPGVVFRLYSRARHADFSQFQTPEVLRTPLMELCLHTKGPSINDVILIFGVFGLPPLPFVRGSRNLSVLFVTHWVTPPP